MDYPVDVLVDTSHEDLEQSAEDYMSSLLFSNPDSPQYLNVPDSRPVPIVLSNVGFVPLYGADHEQKVLALFSPDHQSTAVGLYLLDRWWSVEEILKTTDPSRKGILNVMTVGEHIVLYILNRVVYRSKERNTNEVHFLCHGESDYAKIFWKDGEAVGFYSVKQAGTLCRNFLTQCYQLPVMDSIFIRKSHRGNGYGLQILKDFVASFKEVSLGLKYPLSTAMYKVCAKYLGLYPEDRELLWEVESVGSLTQRVMVAEKIQAMALNDITPGIYQLDEKEVVMEEVEKQWKTQETMQFTEEILEEVTVVRQHVRGEHGCVEPPITNRGRSSGLKCKMLTEEAMDTTEDHLPEKDIRIEDIEAHVEFPEIEPMVEEHNDEMEDDFDLNNEGVVITEQDQEGVKELAEDTQGMTTGEMSLKQLEEALTLDEAPDKLTAVPATITPEGDLEEEKKVAQNLPKELNEETTQLTRIKKATVLKELKNPPSEPVGVVVENVKMMEVDEKTEQVENKGIIEKEVTKEDDNTLNQILEVEEGETDMIGMEQAKLSSNEETATACIRENFLLRKAEYFFTPKLGLTQKDTEILRENIKPATEEPLEKKQEGKQQEGGKLDVDILEEEDEDKKNTAEMLKEILEQGNKVDDEGRMEGEQVEGDESGEGKVRVEGEKEEEKQLESLADKTVEKRRGVNAKEEEENPTAGEEVSPTKPSDDNDQTAVVVTRVLRTKTKAAVVTPKHKYIKHGKNIPQEKVEQAAGELVEGQEKEKVQEKNKVEKVAHFEKVEKTFEKKSVLEEDKKGMGEHVAVGEEEDQGHEETGKRTNKESPPETTRVEDREKEDKTDDPIVEDASGEDFNNLEKSVGKENEKQRAMEDENTMEGQERIEEETAIEQKTSAGEEEMVGEEVGEKGTEGVADKDVDKQPDVNAEDEGKILRDEGKILRDEEDERPASKSLDDDDEPIVVVTRVLRSKTKEVVLTPKRRYIRHSKKILPEDERTTDEPAREETIDTTKENDRTQVDNLAEENKSVDKENEEGQKKGEIEEKGMVGHEEDTREEEVEMEQEKKMEGAWIEVKDKEDRIEEENIEDLDHLEEERIEKEKEEEIKAEESRVGGEKAEVEKDIEKSPDIVLDKELEKQHEVSVEEEEILDVTEEEDAEIKSSDMAGGLAVVEMRVLRKGRKIIQIMERKKSTKYCKQPQEWDKDLTEDELEVGEAVDMEDENEAIIEQEEQKKEHVAARFQEICNKPEEEGESELGKEKLRKEELKVEKEKQPGKVKNTRATAEEKGEEVEQNQTCDNDIVKKSNELEEKSKNDDDNIEKKKKTEDRGDETETYLEGAEEEEEGESEERKDVELEENDEEDKAQTSGKVEENSSDNEAVARTLENRVLTRSLTKASPKYVFSRHGKAVPGENKRKQIESEEEIEKAWIPGEEDGESTPPFQKKASRKRKGNHPTPSPRSKRHTMT